MSVFLNWSVWYAPSDAASSAARARILGMSSGVMPSGLGSTSSRAPKASIVRSFSSAKASEVTICRG